MVKKIFLFFIAIFMLNSCLLAPFRAIGNNISDGLEDMKENGKREKLKEKSRYLAFEKGKNKEGVSRTTLRVIARPIDKKQVISTYNKAMEFKIPQNTELRQVEYDIELIDIESGYGLPVKFYAISNPCERQDMEEKYFKQIVENEYYYIESYTYDGKELAANLSLANGFTQICKNDKSGGV